MKLCECNCGQETKNNNKFIHGHNRKNKYHTDESKNKMSVIRIEICKKMTDVQKSNLHKRFKGISGMKGKSHTEESKKKMSQSLMGRVSPNKNKKFSDDHKLKLSIAHIGKLVGDKNPMRQIEHVLKVSGENSCNWKGGISFGKYCSKFNNAKKEEIRNKYNRKCYLCNKNEKENITKINKVRKLSVHHIDADKMQGCNGKQWKLVPLCMHCHNNKKYINILKEEFL